MRTKKLSSRPARALRTIASDALGDVNGGVSQTTATVIVASANAISWGIAAMVWSGVLLH